MLARACGFKSRLAHIRVRLVERVCRVLALKRMRRRAGVFVAIFGVVALLAGLSVGLSGYLGAAASAGVRAGVQALAGVYGGFRVSAPLSDDAQAQDAAVRADIHASVRVNGRTVPLTVARDVVTLNPIPFDRPHGAPVRSSVASIPDLASRARLVAGAWPTDAGQASMQADAAAALKVMVGDELMFPDGTPITITATWRVSSANDPRWLEDPVALSGADMDTIPGWVVIDPSEWTATEAQPVARWTVRPDADRVMVAQLGALERAPDTVSNAVQKQNPDADVRTEGSLQLGLAPIQQNVQAAAAVSIAPLVVVALLGLITLIELAGMLVQLRSGETGLLRARGTSPRRFVAEGMMEGLLTAVPAAALGAAAAGGVLAARGLATEVPAVAWFGAGACALAAVVVLGVSAARASRDPRPASGARGTVGLPSAARLRSTAAVGALLLVMLLAIVAVSQFILYGSPLAPVSGGGVAVDPLAVSAPALAIAAIGLLAVAAFPAASRGLERLAGRARALDSLPLQQLARRSRAALTPILVLAFGVSGLILGACYSGTWIDSANDTRQVQVGTSVRVTSPPPLSASVAQRIPGQTGAAPVAREDAQLGGSLVDLLGIPATRIPAAVTAVSGAVDPAALAAKVVSPVDRPQVPESATGVEVDFVAAPTTAAPTAGSVVLVDAVGAETAVNLTPSGDGLAGTLPSGAAPWTVHGISLLLPELPAGATLVVEVRATGASTAAIPLDSSWVPSGGGDGGPVAARRTDGLPGLKIVQEGPAGYVLLQSVRTGGARLPVVISRALSESAGLHVGSAASMTLVTRGGSVPIKVAAIVPVVPGIESGEGVLADLGALQDAAEREGLLQVSSREWWISTTSPSRVAAAERTAHPDAGVALAVPSPAEQVLESARVVVWIAGIATALLALLAIGAGLLAELRTRRGEVHVLQAVGATPRAQVNGRMREWAMLLGFGAAVGAVDGLVVCVLLVPSLARIAVPHALAGLRTSLNLDVSGALVALVVIVAALAVLLLIIARTVRAQARISPRADPTPTGAES